MKRRVFAALTIVVLLGSLVVAALPVAAEGPPKVGRNNMEPPGPEIIDATYMLGDEEVAFRKHAAQVGPAATIKATPSGMAPVEIGEEITITVSDSGTDTDYDETFVVILDGTHGIILVEKGAVENYDAGADEYVFANPSSCWRDEDRISTAQLEYMLDQFDNVIYPTDTATFGEPLERGEEGRKIWMLIHNIRDEAYYDCSATSYVAGYFSASEDATYTKNMIHIDSYDWANRVGGDANRPYLYEGAFAHEFEHLIHFDQDPDEESWVDEGLADLAGYFCGYGHSAGHVAEYIKYHPMTSLTFWGSSLEDYGASYLFQLYLYEKYGGKAFSSALVQEQANGIEGIENTLAAFGYRDTFDEIFDNWTIANYLDDTRKGGGKYGYETLEMGTADSQGWTIEYVLNNFWSGAPEEAPFAVTSDWFFGIEPQPYTAHYFRFTNGQNAKAAIDGDDYAGTPAHGGTYEWYSGAEAWAWRTFYQSFEIPEDGATLNFYTFYDIEEDWDYGYVEAYDQHTGEWYTLDATGTVDDVAHVQDNPNTPAGREPADYEAAGRWHAFTGSSGGWVPVSMDLSPFAGHTIDLYFTTWQDGAFTLQMMYVDDISIPELGFSDDVESGEDGWTAAGWSVSDGRFANGFSVTTADSKWVPAALYPEPAGNNAMELHSIRHMTVDLVTQTGEDMLPATELTSGRVQVAVVSNHADHILTSHYEFSVN